MPFRAPHHSGSLHWDPCADLRADHVAGDHEFHTPILLPSGRGVVGSHRLSLAEALRRDRTRRHSLPVSGSRAPPRRAVRRAADCSHRRRRCRCDLPHPASDRDAPRRCRPPWPVSRAREAAARYLAVSKRTSDMFTIKPRAVSRVCRMALNCFSSWARSSAFSASACAFSFAARSSSAWLAALCASFSRFRRSASRCAAAAAARLVLRLSSDRLVAAAAAIARVVASSTPRARFGFSPSPSGIAACASFSRVRRSASACACIRAASASRVTRSVSDCAATRPLSARASRSADCWRSLASAFFLLTS